MKQGSLEVADPCVKITMFRLWKRYTHTQHHVFSLYKKKKKRKEESGDVTSGEEGADHETEADSSHDK